MSFSPFADTDMEAARYIFCFTKVKIYPGDVIYGLEISFVVKPNPPLIIRDKKRTSIEVYILLTYLNSDIHVQIFLSFYAC